MGCAQTGTGKTCAFAVPIIQRLAKSEGKGHHPCAHHHADARARAADLRKTCQYARYVPCSAAVIFGGVSQVPQVEAIERGVDILIATPGRLWDLMGQKIVKLDKAEFFVLDEADRMLDMGFSRMSSASSSSCRKAPDPAVLGYHSGGDCRSGRENAA